MNCIHCGKDAADYPFRVLQVQTLHVRDLGGEKRVQALGDFEEYTVCADCARAKYDACVNSQSVLLKACLPYGILTVAGMMIAAVCWSSNGAFRLLGLGMLVCGLLGLYSTVKTGSSKKRELLSLSSEEALRRCAWDCLLESAPKKNDVNDISYIPVNAETLARKNGDLMILYDLLSEIAVQAWNRLHETDKE